MKNFASLLAMAGIWFLSLIGMGFLTRMMCELVLLGWRAWP